MKHFQAITKNQNTFKHFLKAWNAQNILAQNF